MLALSFAFTLSKEDGLARTPPRGWRSWNTFGSNVTQAKMEAIMDAMVRRDRSVDGVPTSLCDLGYCDGIPRLCAYILYIHILVPLTHATRLPPLLSLSVGLDDNWQACSNQSTDEWGQTFGTYHDSAGNPLVNETLFPSMEGMVQHAHELNLTAGWYGNNCLCRETNGDDPKYYVGDVKAIRRFGFDGIKLDACGAHLDVEMYSDLIDGREISLEASPVVQKSSEKSTSTSTSTSKYPWDNHEGSNGKKVKEVTAQASQAIAKPVLIENCHWGTAKPFAPTATWCPWHVYRTSMDVMSSYASVVRNLQTVVPYADAGLSRPGCWAYPDMLEIGTDYEDSASAQRNAMALKLVKEKMKTQSKMMKALAVDEANMTKALADHEVNGTKLHNLADDEVNLSWQVDQGLSLVEQATHFHAWAIASSPLVLSHDVTDSAISDAVWPLISNPEVLEVNSAWAGHSGSPFYNSNATIDTLRLWNCCEDWQGAKGPPTIPSEQYWYKPLKTDGTRTAVLLMNHGDATSDLSLTFADIPGVKCTTCHVRDIVARKDLGTFTNTYIAQSVESHAASFLMISPEPLADASVRRRGHASKKASAAAVLAAEELLVAQDLR